MEYLQWLESEILKADKALTIVPKDDNLKLRAAFARLQELNTAKRIFKRFTHEQKIT